MFVKKVLLKMMKESVYHVQIIVKAVLKSLNVRAVKRDSILMVENVVVVCQIVLNVKMETVVRFVIQM